MIIAAEAFLNQIPNIIDSLTKFVAENGLLAAVIVMIVLGVIASIILLLYVLLQLIKLQFKAQENSAERDRRIDRVSVKVEDVADKQERVVTIIEPIKGAFEKLTTALDTNTDLTRATVKSYETIETSVVKSYDATSIAIGLSGDKIRKNSDENTKSIIDEVHKLPSAAEIRQELEEPFRQIRIDISKIIDPELAAKVVAQIKPDLVALVENALADCLKQNADPITEPLPTIVLSPVDGEANRKLLDTLSHKGDDDPEPPTPPEPGARQPVPSEPDNIVALPQVDAMLPKTGTEG